MDLSSLKRLNFSVLLLVIAFGLIFASIIYQAQTKDSKPTQELRTILKEESSIISVVDSASSSVVAIGVPRKIVDPSDPFSSSVQDSTIGTGFVVSDKC